VPRQVGEPEQVGEPAIVGQGLPGQLSEPGQVGPDCVGQTQVVHVTHVTIVGVGCAIIFSDVPSHFLVQFT